MNDCMDEVSSLCLGEEEKIPQSYAKEEVNDRELKERLDSLLSADDGKSKI